MSFNVWNFAFNELCDLKNLKKLISGSFPTPIIQSYINNWKIYIWAWSTKNALWFAYCFVNLFNKYIYLLFFKSDHIRFQHRFKHIFVHIKEFFFYFFKNWKTKDTLLKRTRRYVMCAFLRIFWLCIFNSADFSLSCFEVAVWFLSISFRSN